jgi:hypothetical protein
VNFEGMELKQMEELMAELQKACSRLTASKSQSSSSPGDPLSLKDDGKAKTRDRNGEDETPPAKKSAT